MPKKYIAIGRVWHSVLREEFEAGEEIPLGHLTEEQIEELAVQQIVRIDVTPDPDPAPAPESPAAPSKRSLKDQTEPKEDLSNG
jgi:hypothetical protein